MPEKVYTGERRIRSTVIEFRARDDAPDTFEAALSSEAPIRVWRNLDEVLIHTAAAIDLTRADGGLPLLWQHNSHQPIGRVDDLKIEDGKLRGVFTFAPNPKAQEVRADVAAGFLRNVSIGYVVHEWIEKDDGRLIEATRWELLEASIVSVPADASVGINRAYGARNEGGNVPQANGAGTAGGEGGGGNVVDFTAAQEIARQQGIEEGRRVERERRDAIELLFIGERFQAPEFQAIRRAALDEGWTHARASAELLRAVGAGVAAPTTPSTFTQGGAVPVGRSNARVTAGEAAIDKYLRGAELQIAVRAGLETDKAKIREAREGEYASFSLVDHAREFAHVVGLDVRGLSRDRMVGKVLQYRASGVVNLVSGDFPSLLENIANKALLLGYDEPTETWRAIARPGNLTDFRQTSRTGLSELDDLELVREGGEYKIGKLSDRAEKIQLASYGKILRLSRRALIDDNLDAFAMVPRKMGRAASRLVGDVVYNAFITNPVMNQDGLALFIAAHANLVNAGNGPPGVAQLSTMKALMGKQKDSSGQTNGLNIRLARVVVPLALEDAARTLQTAELFQPAAASTFIQKNIHQGTFETVADARLDAVSAVQWYTTADPMLYDVIEVGFLDGQQEPFLEQQDGWTIDGVEFKVRMDCAAIPLDYRTLVRNNG